MSRGQQRKITIPPHWWIKLEEECKSRGIENVEQLCASRPGFLNPRTIRNAEKHGEMTEASFRQLALLLGYQHSHALKGEWNKAVNDPASSSNRIMDAVQARGTPVADSAQLTTGRAGLASGQPAPGNPTDRIFTTQQDLPQWADPWELDLGNGWLESVACMIETDADYFRFGFKLLGEHGRLFGDGSIQSQDTNLVIHLGRNNWDRANPPISVRDIFLAWFKNGIKRGKDARLFAADPHFVASVSLVIDSSHVARFLVNGECCLQTVIPPEIRRRVVMLAWGDSEECTVRVSDICVHTLPDL